ncbi:hypothetical protein M0805_000439 [Coniferiporia weirii]|nr:hypothetical protein M0805_000439 [Coniferiporia weirii]
MRPKSNPRVAPARKSHAIKRTDAEPLTREDLQYDLLKNIFDDRHAVFTDPFDAEQSASKVTFRDLYINALVSSPRSSKAIRDNISEFADFGTDFAMISLLANVGRINTTMAFFPETRTALRTYHPVPALQRTDCNLQDAPRIKNALKACVLPSEAKGAPTTPGDILLQRDAGHVPSTSVVNLIFVLNNHSGAVSQKHFDPDNTLDFVDLFLPVPVPSAARARVFLWLCFHYLEPPNAPNPYDDHEHGQDARAPRLLRLSAEEAVASRENVDPPDEIARGAKMMEQRRAFIARERQEASASAATREDGASERGETPPVGGRSRARGKGASAADPPLRGRPTKHQSREALTHKTSHQLLAPDSAHTSAPGEPYPRMLLPALSSGSISASGHTRSGADNGPLSKTVRGRRTRRGQQAQTVEVVYAPPSPKRTMLQHAWHIVTTTDPLMNSDEEQGDEHVRLDYTRRLRTLKRLRGKSPTPEPEPQQLHPTAMAVDNTNGW